MKFLEKFEGKILSKKEQKEVNGGITNCNSTSTLSWGGCSVETYTCMSNEVGAGHESNTGYYERSVYRCSGNYVKTEIRELGIV